MAYSSRRRKSLVAALSLSTLLQACGLHVGEALAQGAARVVPVPAGAPQLVPGLSGSLGAAAAPWAVAAPQAAAPAWVLLGSALAAPALPLASPAAPSPLAAGLPALARPADAVSLAAERLGRRVDAALEAAGPIERAPAAAARSLGVVLEAAISGESPIAGAGDAVPAPAPALTSDQRRRLESFTFLARVYTEHYAPARWKKELGVDLLAEHRRIKAEIEAKPDMGQVEFQRLVKGFVTATRDFHAGIQFASTERSKLPLRIQQAEGKYWIAQIDRKKLPKSKFPFSVGDEVVEFGGRPVAEAVAELVGVPNMERTDARIAEGRLTARARLTGAAVPQGEVAIKIRAGDSVREATLTWDYRPEGVPLDVAAREGGLFPEAAGGGTGGAREARVAARATGLRQALKRLMPSLLHPFADDFSRFSEDDPNDKFAMGKSFVPYLGKPIWELELPDELKEDVNLEAYIYKNEEGRAIGVIRIPDYMGNEKSAAVFAGLIKAFQKNTEGLVIDQVNNPGGNMFYMNALISMLNDEPVAVPKHQAVIDESDAQWAAQLLEQFKKANSDQAAREALREDRAGFKLSASEEEGMLEGIKKYAMELLAEFAAGRRLTNELALFGQEKINPHPEIRYAKPIVVLVNELDFSAADFFPSILQDAKRATIFGVRTGGAGGAVKSVEFPNQQGITGFSYTWTFARRPTGSPLENRGVEPDVAYEPTALDYRRNFAGYARAVNATMSGLLPAAPVRPKAGPEAEGRAALRVRPRSGRGATSRRRP
ncbi:MAG: protease-like activity factor CPAF [Elusimicrobia bacterium]|nr:protease-like activity factor CPAF [Elusimicrobiota bacterium]